MFWASWFLGRRVPKVSDFSRSFLDSRAPCRVFQESSTKTSGVHISFHGDVGPSSTFYLCPQTDTVYSCLDNILPRVRGYEVSNQRQNLTSCAGRRIGLHWADDVAARLWSSATDPSFWACSAAGTGGGSCDTRCHVIITGHCLWW